MIMKHSSVTLPVFTIRLILLLGILELSNIFFFYSIYVPILNGHLIVRYSCTVQKSVKGFSLLKSRKNVQQHRYCAYVRTYVVHEWDDTLNLYHVTCEILCNKMFVLCQWWLISQDYLLRYLYQMMQSNIDCDTLRNHWNKGRRFCILLGVLLQYHNLHFILFIIPVLFHFPSCAVCYWKCFIWFLLPYTAGLLINCYEPWD